MGASSRWPRRSWPRRIYRSSRSTTSARSPRSPRCGPVEFEGRSVDLAGDTETPLEIAARLTTALGEPVSYEEVQVEGVFVYQEASTQVHDVEWLRGVYPGLHTFSSWLERGRRARALPARGRTDDRPDGAAGGLTGAGRAVSGGPRR